jgi:hypothetical protein
VDRGLVVGPADWPAIIDDGQWARVQTRLNGIPINERPGGFTHLLSGLARCGVRDDHGDVCGQSLATNKASRAQHSVLMCPRLHLARREDEVDRLVEAAVVDRLSRSDVVALLTDIERADSELKSALDLVAVLEARLADGVAQFVAGKISAVTVGNIESQLEPKLAAARHETHRWSGLPEIVSEVAGPNAAAKWPKLGIEQRRALVAALVTVTIYPVGKGVRNEARKMAAIQIEPRQTATPAR